MKYITKLKLAAIHQFYDLNNESTEKMYQVMQDTCKVSLDTCINYIELGEAEHKKLSEEFNSLSNVVSQLEFY
jgi:hypothetical protein